MSEPLFVYGTLRDPALLALVLGRAMDPHRVLAAAAPGRRAVCMPQRSYPGLRPAPGATALGLLLLGLSPFELDLLDRFEGDEYRRALLPVIADAELHEALAYLPVGPLPPDLPEWRFDAWQREHRQGMLAAEALVAEDRRRQLLAMRPH
jgi:gamma-glutamylcyclotransferase (GGCT)/AIG2-like uncharacterized protein YtfP